MKIVDILDIDSGNATTELTLSVYQPSVPGQLDDNIAAPPTVYQNPTVTNPEEAPNLDTHIGRLPSVPVDSEDWRGYIGNNEFLTLLGVAAITAGANVYDERFVVEFPEVSDSERNENINQSDSTHNVAIPQNDLTVIG